MPASSRLLVRPEKPASIGTRFERLAEFGRAYYGFRAAVLAHARLRTYLGVSAGPFLIAPTRVISRCHFGENPTTSLQSRARLTAAHHI